jgi:hypothetical protein
LRFKKAGRPAFVIHRGATAATLQSATPLPVGRFARLTVTLQDSVARIYIDGRLAGENIRFPFSPEDVRARAGRIGAGLSGPGFFGALDDFAVYRTGIASISDAGPMGASPDAKNFEVTLPPYSVNVLRIPARTQ